MQKIKIVIGCFLMIGILFYAISFNTSSDITFILFNVDIF